MRRISNISHGSAASKLGGGVKEALWIPVEWTVRWNLKVAPEIGMWWPHRIRILRLLKLIVCVNIRRIIPMELRLFCGTATGASQTHILWALGSTETSG